MIIQTVMILPGIIPKSSIIRWKLQPWTWSNWNERTRIWINSGDMPDVMVFNFTQTNYPEAAGYVEQGLLYKFAG